MDQIAKQAWSLNPGRYVGVAESEDRQTDRLASPNAAIPDFVAPNPGHLERTQTVSGLAGAISDLNVKLNIVHSNVGDLTITLKNDDTGKTVKLNVPLDGCKRTPSLSRNGLPVSV